MCNDYSYPIDQLLDLHCVSQNDRCKELLAKIKGSSVDSEKCLDIMELALWSVPSRYVIPKKNNIFVDNIRSNDERKESNDVAKDPDYKDIELAKDLVERCFAYELYHQLRNIITIIKVNDLIEVNAEIPKSSSSTNYYRSELNQDDPKLSLKPKYPDIILHGGQLCKEESKQFLVCEIKRNLNKKVPCKKDLRSDLIKLAHYITNLQSEGRDLGYRHACFIMTDISETDLMNGLIKILKEKDIKFYNGYSVETSLKNIANQITIFNYEVPQKDGTDEVDYSKRIKVGKFSLESIYENLDSQKLGQ